MFRVSEKEAVLILRSGKRNKRRKNKYGAKRTTLNGITFASKREAARYQDLTRLIMAGEIRALELQPSFEIKIENVLVCRVVLDFKYYCDKKRCWVYEDSKGRDNPLSKLKRKLVEAAFSIKVTIV